MFIDSHCHLNFPELSSRLPEVLQAMAEAQVSRAICISTMLETFEDVHALAMAHPSLWASVGVHPDTEGQLEPTLQDLLTRAQRPKVVAIGETGLDYYRLNGRTVQDMAWQRQRFVLHIQAARQTGLPLVIHTRSAAEDTLRLLREHGTAADGAPAVRGVFHCFTETLDVARAALDMGFELSFSGIVTFKSASDLREVVRFVPLDRLLIETDSPYLAPVPHRGQVNTPALVPWVARQVAQIKGTSIEAVAEATSANTLRLFDRMRLEESASSAAVEVRPCPAR